MHKVVIRAQEYFSLQGIKRIDIKSRYSYSLDGRLNYEKLYRELKEDELVNAAKLIVGLNLSLEEVFRHVSDLKV